MGKGLSELQRDIFQALKDEKKTIMLAKILKSDFKFDDIAKETTSKVTKQVKKELEHTETKTPSRSKGGSLRQAKSLGDYF